MGPAGARPHRRRDGRAPPSASVPARRSTRRSRTSTRARPTRSSAPTPCSVDAGQGRRRDRRPGRHALRHPRADPAHRVPHRADAAGRHLLHRPQRGPHHPSRAHVVVGAEGRHRVRHLARADHRLPRGRARPSPPGRPDGLPQRPAQPLAAAGVVDQRARRGVGAVLRAADGRARLPRRPGRLPRHAGRAVACARPASCSTSASTASSPAPAVVGGGAWDYDKAWTFLERARATPTRAVAALRARPLPGLAGPGAVVQDRRAAVAAAARGRPRRGRATPSTSRPSTAALWTSARSAWTSCAAPCSASPISGSPSPRGLSPTSVGPAPAKRRSTRPRTIPGERDAAVGVVYELGQLPSLASSRSTIAVVLLLRACAPASGSTGRRAGRSAG